MQVAHIYIHIYIYTDGWDIRTADGVSAYPEMQTRLKRVSALYIFCQNEVDIKQTNHVYVQESRSNGKSKYGRLRQRSVCVLLRIHVCLYLLLGALLMQAY